MSEHLGRHCRNLEILVAERSAELQSALDDTAYLAYHDALTKLPNRLLLQDRLEHALARARRNSSRLALFFLDLDRFKTINDSLGHEVGDQLLIAMANRLQNVVRQADTLARFGGDEFVILVEDAGSTTDLASFGDHILAGFKQPLQVGTREFLLSVSMGIGIFPEHADNLDGLLRCADIAMFQTKEQGRNGYHFFTNGQNRQMEERLALENSLARAVAEEQLCLHYQPQIDMQSGKILGFEALLRWQHPTLGMISPSGFITLAEETGHIVAFGEWALRTTCTQAVAWQRSGLPPVRVAVNLSAREFRRGGLANRVKAALADSGLSPQWLALEITESMVMGNVEEAASVLRNIAELGVGVAMDDFGTGYSSLGRLKSFPIKRLKVDKTFIQDAPASRNDGAIVESIIALAQAMELEVVAEGVETLEQVAFLVQRGCRVGQGFLFAKGLTADDCTGLLADGAVLSRWKKALPEEAMAI